MMDAILMVGKIGTTELLIVLVVLLLLFGPKYLPKLGQTFGDTLRGFKDGLAGDDKPADNNNVNASTSTNATAGTTESNGKTEA